MNKKELVDALADAANKGDTARAKELVAQGADPEKTAEYFIGPPLLLAVNGGHEETARWLLESKVKLPRGLLRTAAYSNGMWPPKFAWLVRQLIEDGADLKYAGGAGDGGSTAMHMICDPELLELALAHGGTLNLKDDEGATPLHWAARTGGERLIGLLIDKGADPNAKDRKGKTPLDYAKARGKYGKAAVALLQQRTGQKPKPPKKGSWQKVEDDLVKRTTKALATFAKKHQSETFGRFAFDCNAAYAEVLPSLQPADAKPLWTIGDWKYQELACFELDLEGIDDAEEIEPFMTMACQALIRLEKSKAFASLARSPKFETLAINHDEGEAAAKKRLKRLCARD
jgi:hypothetical protein